jgi:hypothetical protein
MEWIDLAQDRDSWRALMNAVKNLKFPRNVGNYLTSRGPVSFSRRTLLHGVRVTLSCVKGEKKECLISSTVKVYREICE